MKTDLRRLRLRKQEAPCIVSYTGTFIDLFQPLPARWGLFLYRKIAYFVPDFPIPAGAAEKMLFPVRFFSMIDSHGRGMLASGNWARVLSETVRRPGNDPINDLKGAITP